MGISSGCFFRFIPGMVIHDALSIAEWYIKQKDNTQAGNFIFAAITQSHRAREASLMEEETAKKIIDNLHQSMDYLDDDNWQKASEYTVKGGVIAINEALQQVVKCELIGRS